MRKWVLIGLVLSSACRQADITEYVDPNIGGVAPLLTTKAPTVHRPYSMARVFPVTKPGLSDRYLSDRIYGFAVNLPAYRSGHVTELMPLPGEISIDQTENASVYDHDHEEVHPWYHRVWLEDHDIVAEWTTTERAVIYRFHFPAENSGNVIFRGNRNATFRILDSVSLSGWEEFRGSRQYFHARFSHPMDRYGVFGADWMIPDRKEIDGAKTGAFVTCHDPREPLEVRIGISYIDEDQARENLSNETEGKSFEQVSEESHMIWKDALGRIRVSGGTERELRIFYTSLYRAYERMVDITESGRYYSGYDFEVHETAGRFFVDDWLWDTFRSQHPLLTILKPERQAEVVQSYVDIYEQSGWMPGFPQFCGVYPAMIGFHSASLIWDAFQKGIRQFDAEKAYEGLK